ARRVLVHVRRAAMPRAACAQVRRAQLLGRHAVVAPAVQARVVRQAVRPHDHETAPKLTMPRHVPIVDETLRDGHQCLWSTRMTNEMMLPVASRMDRV